jgi:hypothetical protein
MEAVSMRLMLNSIAAAWVVVTSTACSADRAAMPAAPSPGPSIELMGTPTGSFRVSGTVKERTAQGTRPLADAAVNLWVDRGRSGGYSYWWWSGKQIYSDTAGTFFFDRLPTSTAWFEAWKDGYVSQCAALPISVSGDGLTVEATLAKRDLAWVDVSAVPASTGGRIVAGRIVENTPDGVRPLAGAFVDFEPVMDWPAAATFSNGDGRYLLCGLSEGQIGVGSGNRVTYVPVPRGLVVDNFDIVLP